MLKKLTFRGIVELFISVAFGKIYICKYLLGLSAQTICAKNLCMLNTRIRAHKLKNITFEGTVELPTSRAFGKI